MTKAERRAAQQAARAEALAERLGSVLALRGGERVLDVGCGAGALAYAVAPRRTRGRRGRQRRVAWSRWRARMLRPTSASSWPTASVSRSTTESSTLRPPCARSTTRCIPAGSSPSSSRVTKPGGIVFVVDQLAPVDEEEARALNEFERARDASTSRVLPEHDLRELFAQLELNVVRVEVDREPRDLDAYLDLAGCVGAERDRVARLAPPGYAATLGWFVLLRP